jgi:hypothetical protein
MADPIGDYSAALDRAAQLHKQGMISTEEYQHMLDKMHQILMQPNADQLAAVPTPMPRPDPRGSTFVERLPPQILQEQGRQLDPEMNKREDFSHDPALNQMQRGYMPARGRVLPDNPASPIDLYIPDQGA